jgi:hypothetical protein
MRAVRGSDGVAPWVATRVGPTYRCAVLLSSFRESQPFSEVAIKRPISAAAKGTGTSSVSRHGRGQHTFDASVDVTVDVTVARKSRRGRSDAEAAHLGRGTGAGQNSAGGCAVELFHAEGSRERVVP